MSMPAIGTSIAGTTVLDLSSDEASAAAGVTVHPVLAAQLLRHALAHHDFMQGFDSRRPDVRGRPVQS